MVYVKKLYLTLQIILFQTIRLSDIMYRPFAYCFVDGYFEEMLITGQLKKLKQSDVALLDDSAIDARMTWFLMNP